MTSSGASGVRASVLKRDSPITVLNAWPSVQMFGATMLVSATGLSLQTILAAYLSIRLKLSY